MKVSSAALVAGGHRYRSARELAGLTQQQVADAVGLVRSSIANFEAGRQDVPVTRLLALCAAVGLDVSVLLATPSPCPSCGCPWTAAAGRYRAIVTVDGRNHEVEMPGCDPAVTRESRPWYSPRLYVDGQSWLWKYALSVLLAPDEEDE